MCPVRASRTFVVSTSRFSAARASSQTRSTASSTQTQSQGFRSFEDAQRRASELHAAYFRAPPDAENREIASLTAGPVQVALKVDPGETDPMIMPRLVAMLERGLGLQ